MLLPSEGFLYDLEHAMQDAPQKERPVGTVPNAADKEGYEDVEIVAPAGTTASAQGDVDIVLEPRGKRDVPTPPKVGYTHRQIRAAEVVDEVKPMTLPVPTAMSE